VVELRMEREQPHFIKVEVTKYHSGLNRLQSPNCHLFA
jgi:hypothetical protein